VPRPRLFAIALLLLPTAGLSAEDWPMWRGPRGDGTTTDANLPLEWSAEKNVVWKTKLEFQGHGSPIVLGDRIYLLGVDDPTNVPKIDDPTPKPRVLMALDRATGKPLWHRTVVEEPLEPIHKLNSRASSTPAADAEHVYVSFLDGEEMYVAAFDHQGEKVWERRPGVFSSKHGYCSSPVLFENLVLVNGDHDGPAYLVALDRETGETVWKTDRENRTRSYCTPIVRELGGRTQMLLSGSLSVCSYDPRTGERWWIVDGPTEQFVASLVENKGMIFCTGGFPDRHVIGIDPTGSGNVTKTHVRWHHERRGVSYVPSPVAAGDWFFLSSDDGIGTCYDAVTGEVQWQERMGRHYSGSLLADGERVYYTDDDGTTKVVRAGPTFELLAENKLGEFTYSSPAISNDQLLIRGVEHLWCIGETE
jgi:outer membrane protein assembly factor BamB